MDYKGKTYNVVYVDPTIGTPGDGSSPAQALDDIPTLDSMSDFDCYLIRRTGDANGINCRHGETTSNKSLLFLGMPKVGDFMYDLVPAAAQTAWDADVENQAVMYWNNANVMTLNGTWEMIMFKNIKFLSMSTSVTGTIIYIDHTDSYYPSNEVIIDNCIFTSGLVGRIADLANDVPTSNYGGNIYVYDGGILTITNNEFDIGANSHVYVGYRCIEIYYMNNEVWQLTGGDRLFYCDQYESRHKTLVFKNVKVHLYVNGSQTNSNRIPGGLYCNRMDCDRTYIDDIQLDMDADVLGTFNSTLQIYEYTWYFQGRELVFTNCTFDFSKCHYLFTGDNDRGAFYFTMGDGSEQKGDRNSIVKNNTWQLASASGLGSTQNKADADPNSERHLVRCHGTENYSLMEDCVIYAPRSRALRANGMSFNNVSIDGACAFYACYGNLSHIGSYWVNNVIYAYYRSKLYIEEIVMNLNNLDDPYLGDSAVYSDTFDGVNIVCNNTNVPLFESLISPGGDHPTTVNMVSFNDVSAGNYRYRSHRHLIETWNVTRDGNNVLKATCIDDNARDPLVIGRPPYKGFLVTPPSIGQKTISIHVAHKNYVNIAKLQREFKVMVRVPKEATVGDTKMQVYSTQLHGIWKEDTTSVYANDSGLTAWVCEIPVDIVTVDKDVEFEFWWSHYSSNGYLYIDPQPLIA